MKYWGRSTQVGIGVMDRGKGRVRKRVRQDVVYMKRLLKNWRSFNWSKLNIKGQ